MISLIYSVKLHQETYLEQVIPHKSSWEINCFSIFYHLKSHHRHNQMLQFSRVDGYDSEEDKEELIKVEATPINVSDRSGNEDFSRVDFMVI